MAPNGEAFGPRPSSFRRWGSPPVLALEETLIFPITLGWKISLRCATLAVVGGQVWKIAGSPMPLFVAFFDLFAGTV